MQPSPTGGRARRRMQGSVSVHLVASGHPTSIVAKAQKTFSHTIRWVLCICFSASARRARPRLFVSSHFTVLTVRSLSLQCDIHRPGQKGQGSSRARARLALAPFRGWCLSQKPSSTPPCASPWPEPSLLMPAVRPGTKIAFLPDKATVPRT